MMNLNSNWMKDLRTEIFRHMYDEPIPQTETRAERMTERDDGRVGHALESIAHARSVDVDGRHADSVPLRARAATASAMLAAVAR